MLSNQDFFYSAAHLQGALKNGFGEAVMFHLLTVARKEVDLALYQVLGLVLQARDTEKLPHTLGLKASVQSQQAGSMFHNQ